jgi:hypothetical protein
MGVPRAFDLLLAALLAGIWIGLSYYGLPGGFYILCWLSACACCARALFSFGWYYWKKPYYVVGRAQDAHFSQLLAEYNAAFLCGGDLTEENAQFVNSEEVFGEIWDRATSSSPEPKARYRFVVRLAVALRGKLGTVPRDTEANRLVIRKMAIDHCNALHVRHAHAATAIPAAIELVLTPTEFDRYARQMRAMRERTELVEEQAGTWYHEAPSRTRIGGAVNTLLGRRGFRKEAPVAK